VKHAAFGLLYRHYGREFLRALSNVPIPDADM